MARLGNTIDGGWYRVDIVSVEQEDGSLKVTLDPDSLWVNRRDWRYWRGLFRVALGWFRGDHR